MEKVLSVWKASFYRIWKQMTKFCCIIVGYRWVIKQDIGPNDTMMGCSLSEHVIIQVVRGFDAFVMFVVMFGILVTTLFDCAWRGRPALISHCKIILLSYYLIIILSLLLWVDLHLCLTTKLSLWSMRALEVFVWTGNRCIVQEAVDPCARSCRSIRWTNLIFEPKAIILCLFVIAEGCFQCQSNWSAW